MVSILRKQKVLSNVLKLHHDHKLYFVVWSNNLNNTINTKFRWWKPFPSFKNYAYRSRVAVGSALFAEEVIKYIHLFQKNQLKICDLSVVVVSMGSYNISGVAL